MSIIIQKNAFYYFFKKYIKWENGVLILKKRSFLDKLKYRFYIIFLLKFGVNNTKLIVEIRNEVKPSVVFIDSYNEKVYAYKYRDYIHTNVKIVDSIINSRNGFGEFYDLQYENCIRIGYDNGMYF